ncbi:MAG TPA: hypothetical protein VD932_04730 [Aquabacterium sp.]|nr:hypothetical protein [Aquabacterium sp.]
MATAPAIQSLALTDRFKRDYKRLDAGLQAMVDDILRNDFMPWPRHCRRHHTLSGYRPTVHVIDVTSNHSHQITFNLDGTVARLLRVGTHKQISRDPG